MKTKRILTFILLLVGLRFGAHGQFHTNTPTIIEAELARFAASQHVRANNQPYQWHALDHMVLHDIDGNPNGYAFVFAKDESRFKAPTDLQQHITGITVRTLTNKLQQTQSSNDAGANAAAADDLFAFDDLAAVITGATAESPLILRHFRGAPEFWIEAVKMDTPNGAKLQAGGSAATHVIMVTPMDFRLVTTSAKLAPGASTEGKASVMPLSASDETVGVQSKKAERISVLRQQAQEREARMHKRFDSVPTEQKQRHEASIQERRDFLRMQWDSKRKEWENAKRAAEGKQ